MGRGSTARAASASARRLGWGLADQALSSMSNFAVGIVVARAVSPHDFGVYAVAFALYTVVLTAGRAFATDPFVVRHSSTATQELRAAAARCAGTAAVLGVAAGAVLAVAAVLLGGQFQAMLLVLAVCMPGLLLQDAWRNIFFGWGRGRHAFLNDLVWAVLLVPAFVIVELTARPTAATLTLAWGSAAAAAALVGIAQARLRPHPRSCLTWLQENRELWPRYLAEAVLQTGTQQLIFVAVGVFAGIVAVGQIKLVQIALGPVNVIIQGIGIFAVPEAVRAMKAGLRRLDAVALSLSALVAGGAACWGVALGVLPERWTSAIVGTSWLAAAVLVLPLSLLQILNGANTGAYVGMRALQAARRSLAIRTFASVVTFVAATVGASLFDARGAAYGMVIGSALSLCAWWLGYVRARAAHDVQPTERAHVKNYLAGQEKTVAPA